MATTRTFIAIRATDEVHARAAQVIKEFSRLTDSVNWVAPDNLHWTLQFLGDITNELMAEVCRLVGKIAARHQPFSLSAQTVSAFPKLESPRTLWLGAGQGSDALCGLQDELELKLCDLGFRPEHRQFVPHLTLGRVGRRSPAATMLAERLLELADFDGGTMAVNEVTVYSSTLVRSVPEYLVLARAPLGD